MRLWARITLLIVIFTSLPWVAAYFLVVGRLENNLEQIARVQIGANISTVTRLLNGQMERLERVLTGLGGRRYLKETLILAREGSPYFDQMALVRYTVEAARAPEFDELLVIDSTGVVLAKASNEFDFGESVASQPWFAEVMSKRKDIRLEPMGKGALFVRSSRVVLFRGKVVGVLSGGFRTDESLLRELAKTTGAHLWITDGSRVLIESDRDIPEPLSFIRNLTPEKNFEKTRYLQRINFKRGPFLFGAMPLLGSKGYYLVVGTSEDRRKDLEEKLRQALLGVVGIMALMGVVVGPLTAFRLLKPVDRLVKGARIIQGGNLDHRVEVKRPPPDLRVLVDSFNEMAAGLKKNQVALVEAERRAAWRDIGVRIAHEIKNPLTPIQVTLESILRANKRQDADFDEHLQEGVETVLKEVDRLRRLAKEFGDFSRLPSPSPQLVQLSELMKRLGILYQEPGKDLRVELVIERDTPIELDPEQILGVVVNLVNNGLQALKENPPQGGGVVTVVVSKGTFLVGDAPQDMALIMVKDNGPGIDPALIPRLFDPYTTTHKGGTGLGLSIVRRTVHDHGGMIEADNGENGGAVFRVYLPLKFKPLAPE